MSELVNKGVSVCHKAVNRLLLREETNGDVFETPTWVLLCLRIESLLEAIEVRVFKRSLCRDTLSWFEVDELSEKVNCSLVKVGTGLTYLLVAIHRPLRERHFHFGEVCEPLPRLFGWRAESFKDFENLTDFRVAVEQWSLVS